MCQRGRMSPSSGGAGVHCRPEALTRSPGGSAVSADRGGVVQTRDEDGTADPRRRRARRRRRPLPLWQELPLLLTVTFCLAVLIRTFLLQVFFIPSGSMTETLVVGDRVLVNKVVYDVRDPARGEVVVFRGPQRWAAQLDDEPDPGFLRRLTATLGGLVGAGGPGEKDFIKRVIGLPGDRVSCCDEQGRVLVNGIAINEPYVWRDSPLDLPPNPGECRARRFDEVVVPPGQLFVLGDNRLVSQDARCQGPVPIDNVVGRAVGVVWPSSRWGALSTPEVFENVPAPAGSPVSGPPPVGPSPDGGVLLLLPLPAAWLSSRAFRPVLPSLAT